MAADGYTVVQGATGIQQDVDNSVYADDLDLTVQRQRTEDPLLIALLSSLRSLTNDLSLAFDPVNGQLRVELLNDQVNIGQISYMGSYPINYWTPSQMLSMSSPLRKRVVIT